MKIYTKTGDEGLTGLYGGGRVAKDTPRICAYGDIDELNSFVGLLRTSVAGSEVDRVLESIQNDLFCIGAELATIRPEKHHVAWNAEVPTARLEQQIDAWEASLTPLRSFILPGGSVAAAQCHLARTVCRRCEREIVHLHKVDPNVATSHIVVYLNRLSDLFFVMARKLNQDANIADVEWTGVAKQ
jgi:cob(I)alamin adenosyltransferase